MKFIKMKPARVHIAECLMIIYMRIFSQHPNLFGLLAKCFTEDSEESRIMVLEILEVLPGLMTEEKVVIEDEIRNKFIEFAMKELQPEVLKTLSVATEANLATRRRYQILNCFHAWMIDQTTDLVKAHIHELNLVNFCIEELKKEQENNEEAADAIIACMSVCKDAGVYSQLYQKIIQGLFSAKREFERYVETGSEEEVQYFISVYSVLVSRIFDHILSEPNDPGIKFMLQGVFLRVMTEKNKDMVSKTTIAITSIIKKLQLDEQASPDKLQKVAHFIEIYHSWFEEIINAACNHCTLSEVKLFHLGTFKFL